MVETREITDDEWDAHKSTITALYSEYQLPQVMRIMEETYNFSASCGQYSGKFKQWGLRKYSSNEEGNSIDLKTRKRKLEGKESEVYIQGKQALNKKAKKDTSRHAPPTRTQPQFSTPSLELLEVDLRMTTAQSIGMADVAAPQKFPVLFQDLESMPRRQIGHCMAQCNDSGDKLCEYIADSPIPQCNSQTATDSNSSLSDGGEVSTTIPIESTSSESRALPAEIFGTSVDPENADYVSEISSQLEDITVERYGGEIMRNVKRRFRSSQLGALFRFISYSVYFSSNNLLSDDKTYKFMRMVIRNKILWALEPFIRTKTPAAEIYASNLLLSATRLEHIETVKKLLRMGADVNAPAGQYPRQTALQLATKMRNAPLLKLLLEGGADPNFSTGIGKTPTPLQEAVSVPNNPQIVRLLLRAGANVNVIPNENIFQSSLLECPVSFGDVETLRLLLEAKAPVNLMPNTCEAALQVAASYGRIEMVDILLKEGADVDAPAGVKYTDVRHTAVRKGRFGILKTPLQRAVEASNVEMVQILLKAGADVNTFPVGEYVAKYRTWLIKYEKEANAPIWTALQAAVANGNPVLVRMLLSAGANINAQGCHDTPLQIAARTGNIWLLQILLDEDADINAPANPYFGMTALQAASRKGDSNLMEFLLGRGADTKAPSSPIGGRTAIQAAAESGDVEALEMLSCLGGDINGVASHSMGRTCLQAAAENGHVQMVRLLLRRGANVNAPAGRHAGRTALQAAIENDQIPVVQILLDAGAEINAPISTEGGISALYAAVKNNRFELAKELLLRKASPNGATGHGTTLELAAAKGENNLVQALIEAGAAVNGRGISDSGSTPLQSAVEKGHVEVVRTLLEAGADVAAPAAKGGGKSALAAAVAGNHIEIAQLLIKKSANQASSTTGSDSRRDPRVLNAKWATIALAEALSRWAINTEQVQSLIDAGADVNAVAPTQEYLPIQKAAMKGCREAVEILLKAGADVNKVGARRTTALQGWIKTRNFDIIELLVKARADINAPPDPNQGRTALQAAVEYGDERLVQYFLKRGADVNGMAAESHGATALQRAAMVGHHVIAWRLLKAGANLHAAGAKVDGRTALDAAAEHGRLDIALLFLKNDTDDETLEVRCEQAAKIAAANGHLVIARVLREYKRA